MSAGQDWENIAGFDPREERYIPLQLDEWKAKHRVEHEGEKLGRANQPAAEEHGLDAMETKIKDWINQRGRICRQNVGRHLSDLERELADLEDDQALAIREQEVAQQVKDGEIALQETVNRIKSGAFSDTENDVRIGSEEFERFRRQARLTRLPDYSHRRSAGWIIGVCLLVEAVLNASLLMDVNPFGLLGSTMQMGLISAVNVFFAGLAMGALLRQRNHVLPTHQGIAWTGIAVLLIAVFLFNLAVGHFRNGMQAILGDPSADVFALGGNALQRLAAGPFDLGSFQTALLVLLGMLCFAIGAWKWYQRDDAYPEYGRRHRQLDGKKAAYTQAYEAANQALRQTYEQHSSKLKDMLQKVEIKKSKWQEVSRRGSKLVADYPTYLSQYQNDLDALLAAYRSANRSARSQAAPPHFDAQVLVDAAILEPPAFSPPDETSMKSIGDSVHNAITKLQDAYHAATVELPTLQAVVKQSTEAVRANG